LLIGTVSRQYFHPSLLVTDSAVFLAAFSSSYKKDKYGMPGSVMLISTDTSIAPGSAVHIAAQASQLIGNETYRSTGIIPLGNKLLLSGNSLVQKETITYHTERQGGTSIQVPDRTIKWVLQSLKLFLLDPVSGALTEHTSELKGDHKNWLLEDMLRVPTADAVDFFISTRYNAGHTGIAHCRLTQYGQWTEEELMVDTRNGYKLANAKAVLPGVLVVPYLRKGHYGLLSVDYTSR